MVMLLCKQIVQCTRREDSHHVNSNSIIYRKRAIARTERERSFLVVKGFNTNVVQFLRPHHVIISNVHVCSFCARFPTCTRCAPKMVLCARKIIIYEGLEKQINVKLAVT